jgi:hypothetical protein
MLVLKDRGASDARIPNEPKHEDINRAGDSAKSSEMIAN